MNRIIVALALSGLLLTLATAGYAQVGINAPAGVSPTQDLEIYTRNGFLVQQKYQLVPGDPNASVTTMVNGANPPALTAVAGILKDPSGDTGYTAGMSYSAVQTITPSLSSSVVAGIEFIFDDLNTEAGNDYVSLTDVYGYEQRFSGSSSPARIVVNRYLVTVRFVTNSNSAVGRGFQLRWRALVTDNVTSPSPLGAGSSLQFDAFRSSFQAGYNNKVSGQNSSAMGSSNTASGYTSSAIGYLNAASGYTSSAMGYSNTASGPQSIAFGFGNAASGQASSALSFSNTASGDYSFTAGYKNVASGIGASALGGTNTASMDYAFASGYKNASSGVYSSALGYNNTVSGFASSALGYNNTVGGAASNAFGVANTVSGQNSSALGNNNSASGVIANALGYLNTASGDYSSAFGNKMNTNGKQGAFMIGDSDPLNQGLTSSGVTDQFVGRFLNGYFLLTCGDKDPGGVSYGTVRTGVQIARGQNSWASISDSTKKERFRPIDHTDLLQKINAMRLTTWNYKGQHTIRHYGPMAQDFFASFGHDGLGQVGCDTLIYSHDFAGVTFAGVQALIRENEALKARLAKQDTRLQQAEKNVRQANARLDALEAVLVPRRRVAHR